MKLSHLLVVLASTALLDGCALSDTENPFGPEDFDVPFETAGTNFEPPAGTNGITPACLWALATQGELRGLADVKLDAGGGQLPALPGIVGACREGILEAVMQCALSPELSIDDPVTGAHYQGWWGLAPGWLKDPLDAAGRRWVTACVIQKLNYHGIEVPILMEGPHPRIVTNPAFATSYPFDDSTAFGDMFSSTAPLKDGAPPFAVYVCTEDDLVSYCGGAAYGSGWASLRICDGVAPGNCGMTFLGRCSDPDVTFNVGGYWQFMDADGLPVTETIRVRLKDPSRVVCN